LGQQSTAQMYQAPPSAMQNIAAAGMGAYGLSKLMANGGQVKGYAYGGELNPMDDLNRMTAAVSKLTDEQLQQVVKRPSSAAQKQAAQLELATRASEKKGLASAYNAMPMAAAGGVVAFGRGGIMHFVEGGGTNINPVDPFAVDRDYAETDEAIDDTNDFTTMGDSKIQAQLNPLLFKAAQRMASEQEYKADNETEEQGITRNMAMMDRLAGPSPYGEIKEQLSGLTAQAKSALEQGKGLAALNAMGAILQGPNFMRALGGAGVAFADSYKGALASNQVAEAKIGDMRINLANGQRAEKLGNIKDAMGSFQAAKKNKLDAFKAQQDANAKALTALSKAQKAVQTPKPVAAAKPKPEEQAQAAFAALAADPTNVEKQQIAAAWEKTFGLSRPAVAAANVTQGGQTARQGPELDLKGQTLDQDWAKTVNTEVDKRIAAIGISDYGRDPAYRNDPIKFKIDLAKRIRAEVLADPNFKKPVSTSRATAAPVGEPMPANPTAESLRDGVVYATNQGALKWNAAKGKFVAVE